MARRAYTAEQREEALALYREHGAAEAARRTGVTAGTIRAWASRGDVATERAEHQRAHIEAARLRWEERRTTMAHEIGETASRALDHVTTSIDSGKARDAKDYATTMAILVDKAQLLSGGATSRFGNPEERRGALDEARERGRHLAAV